MIIVVLAFFVLDWLAVGFNWKKIKPIAKVLAMILVIVCTVGQIKGLPNPLVVLLIMGQCFGLIGDILLLFSERWFLAGLGAFLVGHFLYLGLVINNLFAVFSTGFYQVSIGLSLILTLLILGSVLWLIYHIFDKQVFLRRNKGKLLWRLVQLYIWILSGLMALTFLLAFIQPNADLMIWLLPVGGTLFLLSDLILAYDRFVKKIHWGQLWVHVTYHLAQISLAAGFLGIFRRL